jgi:hypothetical protein
MEVFVDYCKYNSNISFDVLGERNEYFVRNTSFGPRIETKNPSHMKVGTDYMIAIKLCLLWRLLNKAAYLAEGSYYVQTVRKWFFPAAEPSSRAV